MEKTKTENKAPEKVRCSEFGCRNCLWAGVECIGGSDYEEKELFVSGKVVSSCVSYTYFD